MAADAQTPQANKVMYWAGWGLSVLPSLLFIFSGGMKLSQSPEAAEGFGKLGWPADLLLPLGIVELVCVALYLSPRTAVLGAILLTGYLGGATATHLRLHDPAAAMAVGVGVLIWLGLFLRDSRIRALIPIRFNP